ncbi:hypothetical protein GOV04_02245 [Candidatus Woesearchaeota archaeon]|nr:hypothetical protein [Candidatus Woesearchaeota archaeon]
MSFEMNALKKAVSNWDFLKYIECTAFIILLLVAIYILSRSFKKTPSAK